MDEKEFNNLVAKMAANDKEHESFRRRLDEVEKTGREHRDIMVQLERQSVATEKLAEAVKSQADAHEKLAGRVRNLETEPAEKWKKITWEIIKAVVLAAAGLVIGKII